MRWVFAVLLAANAAYFGWQTTHREPPPPPPVTADQPVAGHVNRLLLVSEVDESELRERGAAPPPERPAPAPFVADVGDETATALRAGSGAPLCLSVGPLTDDRQIGEVEAWLRAAGAQAQLRVGERREVSLFWVYFPPFPTLEEAMARRDQMQALGIEDLFVIPRGDMAGAISLGVYSQRRSLERRLTELRGHGYEPSIVPRYRTTKASWFDARLPPGESFPEERFNAAFPDTEARAVHCQEG